MAKLIYVSNVSLDGYIEDEQGSFDWTEPDDELFVFITDLVRPAGNLPLRPATVRNDGRLGDDASLATQSELMANFANVWKAADKVVYSTTLDAVSTAKTQLERTFDPASVRDMKTSAGSDLVVGGADLAAQAFEAGLVDECQLIIRPVLVGEASLRSPATPAPTLSCWNIAGSTTVSCTCATASRPKRSPRDQTAAYSRRWPRTQNSLPSGSASTTHG